MGINAAKEPSADIEKQKSTSGKTVVLFCFIPIWREWRE